MSRLQGRVAAITGSSRGIGRAIAEAYLAEGARVVVNSRHAEAAAATARELGADAEGVAADVSTPEGAQALVEAALRRFGRLDIMVANAGINIVKDAIDYRPEEWRQVLATNLDGVFYSAQAAGKVLMEQGSGSVIVVASVTSFNAFPQRVAYATAKAGVVMMTKVLAVEWAPRGVRVNAIAPGYVSTDLVKGLIDSGRVDTAAVQRRTPMGRMAGPEEIATTAVFLASDEAGYITGETIAVDGGWLAYGWV
ncbi:MAG TPA: SDR family NAD(P)-dependent oxidoreductase [Candidatus Dormibacteraeota bacterium]